MEVLSLGYISDFMRGNKQPTGEATAEELQSHHCYTTDLMSDGFVSPMVLPNDRLRELKGDMSVEEMANICKMPTRELVILLDHDYLEPTARQLLSISRGFHVSVIWLLGYHTAQKAYSVSNDLAMLSLIGRRNAAEESQYRDRSGGFLEGLFLGNLANRIQKWNLQVYNLAARHTAMEHLPLTNEELYKMTGQPAFLELSNGEVAWGIVRKEDIVTATGTYDILNNGDQYQAYITPDTAISIT